VTNEQILWVVARALQAARPQTNPWSETTEQFCAVLRSIGVELEVIARDGDSPAADRERARLRRLLGL